MSTVKCVKCGGDISDWRCSVSGAFMHRNVSFCNVWGCPCRSQSMRPGRICSCGLDEAKHADLARHVFGADTPSKRAGPRAGIPPTLERYMASLAPYDPALDLKRKGGDSVAVAIFGRERMNTPLRMFMGVTQREGKSWWCLPAGGVLGGETFLGALKRIMLSIDGMRIDTLMPHLVGVSVSKKSHGGGRHMDFVFTVPCGSVKLPNGSLVSQANGVTHAHSVRVDRLAKFVALGYNVKCSAFTLRPHKWTQPFLRCLFGVRVRERE
jgi:ADP-ribose pyrophosphatase YjhB (NUDIX family)